MLIGSGFEDIIIEADICASGSIEKVMLGKHYNRAMRVHQRVTDALERMLMSEFMVVYTDNIRDSGELKTLGKFPTFDHLEDAQRSEHCLTVMTAYENFKIRVRQGELGKTARFWIMYIDCVWTLLRFQQAYKENNFDQYVASLRQLCGLFFSFDHLNYARYLPLYYMQLKNWELSHPGAVDLLRNNGISVARSNIPACRNAIDITIEQTINRFAKCSRCVIGRNLSAYHRWCVTRHIRATYVEAAMDRADILSGEATLEHRTSKPSHMKKSETDVMRIVSSFKQFMNPFNMNSSNHDTLFCLSSASSKITDDLLRYSEVGNSAAQSFIETRLVNKSIKFHDPMRKLNLHTFQSMAIKRTVTSTQSKAICVKAERNLFGKLLLLSREHDID